MTLLAAQMQHQDPDNPMSGTDFATQLAQFSTLQGMQQLNTNFSSLLQLQGVTQAANLIGANVSYVKPGSATTAKGTVSGIQLDATGNVQLTIGTAAVPLNQVRGIA
jgi:flagellar basal-body rod modification protein FlgD